MNAAQWAASGRDESYTRLCEAITRTGRDEEGAFLARLCLLLLEEVGDTAVIESLIAEATMPPDAPGSA